MPISDVISVTITVQDASPSVASFGTPLILAKHGNFTGGKLYVAGPSGLAAMVTDGFTANDRAYHLASEISAQNPGTDKFYVYERLTGGNVQTMTLTPINTNEGFVYEFDVRASGQATTTSIAYTVLAAATATIIATALTALIDAATGVDAADGTGFVTITPTTVDTFVYINGLGRVADVTLADGSSDAGVATDLAQAVVDLGSAFYGIVLDSFSEAESNAAATFALANNKIFGAQSADSDIVTASSTDLASDIQAATNHNAYAAYSRTMDPGTAAGLMSRQFSRDPGSSSWYFKTIAGAVADNLAASADSLGRGKNAMLYVSDNGIAHTSTGRAASGRSLETTRAVASMKAQIEAAVVGVFANNEKLGFTLTDIAQLKQAVSGILTSFDQAGFIVPAGDENDGWFVTATALADVSAVDKAAGLFDGITFHAVLTGEVEKVIVDGTITL